MPSAVNSPLENKRIVIIGGSSGIGLATAQAAADQGAEVIIASRSQTKLDAAQKAIDAPVETHMLDITDEQGLIRFFKGIGAFDHLATPGCTAWMGKLFELPVAEAKAIFDSKFWGQYMAAKYGAPNIRDGGSVVFFSGASSVTPPPSGGAVPASMNAAVEGMSRALALELAPIRVNTVSPGLIDTPVYAEMMSPEQRQGMFENAARMLPVRRVGRADDVAQTVLHVMANGYISGSILDVDGGRTLR